MSLSFIGAHGAFERRWIVYALFRDNVQHHLEGGTPSSNFDSIHAMAGALGAGASGVEISSPKLRAELTEASKRLRDVPIADLAISLRTRAVTTHCFPLPEMRTTELIRAVGWSVPFSTEGATTLGDLFNSFVDELLAVMADDEGTLRVLDA
jgi:hypothetical protein